MRFNFVSLLFLAVSLPGFSDSLSAQDFTKTDARARAVPIPKSPDIKKLAEALSTGCLNQKEKARSFFVWLSENIHYDLKLREAGASMTTEKRLSLQTPEQVIKRKKAVCEGYTNLFNALCASAGIRAFEVPGISKNQIGNISRNGHTWSVIQADGQWGLVDATWGAGVVDADNGKYHEQLNGQYFFASPEILIADHYPDDPLFQYLSNPLTLSEFKLPPLKSRDVLIQKMKGAAVPGFENIPDSLSAINPNNNLQYWYSAGLRSLQINPKSNFGAWALGNHFYQRSVVKREAYFQAIKDLKSVNYYPSAEWFDLQKPVLQEWAALAERCVETLKNANLPDGYSKQVQILRQNAQSSLSLCKATITENGRFAASIKKGVKVKLMLK